MVDVIFEFKVACCQTDLPHVSLGHANPGVFAVEEERDQKNQLEFSPLIKVGSDFYSVSDHAKTEAFKIKFTCSTY